nr:vitamin D3 25-hydroxylase, 25-hydroxylating cytochrome P-450 {N-terminal} [swine, liver microsomes, Peptide Partial, 16 aa] [Sus scrofa]
GLLTGDLLGILALAMV